MAKTEIEIEAVDALNLAMSNTHALVQAIVDRIVEWEEEEDVSSELRSLAFMALKQTKEGVAAIGRQTAKTRDNITPLRP